MKVASFAENYEQSEARGGAGNVKRIIWDHSKTATITFTDALISNRGLELVKGVGAVEGATTVYAKENLVVTGGKITLANTPLATTVNVMDKKGVILSSTVAGNEVTPTGVTNGDTVTVTYKYTSTATAKKLSVKTNSFSGYFKLIAFALIRNAETGQDEALQLVFPKVKLKANQTLEFRADGEPTTFDFEAEVLASNANDFYEIIQF